jgi:hypothetical protein
MLTKAMNISNSLNGLGSPSGIETCRTLSSSACNYHFTHNFAAPGSITLPKKCALKLNL